jgi:Uma2 family endonuclease
MANAIERSVVRGLRRVEYEKLAEVGAFGDERVELLYGRLVAMSPKGPRHESALQRLTRIFVHRFDGRATVRIQAPFAASDGSEPEPDLALVPLGEYDDAHPSVAHLLVEVAQSSLELDRTTKAQLFAECGVPEYWVVNLVDGLVETYGEIVRGAYSRVTPFRRGEAVRLREFPDVRILVDDVLPPLRP